MSAVASAASATHEHVMAHEPWKYVYPVTDGASIWLHIGCFCGKSTHVVELAVAWQPRPPEEIPCLWCHRPLPEPRGTRKYHPECAGPAKKARHRENERALRAMEAVGA